MHLLARFNKPMVKAHVRRDFGVKFAFLCNYKHKDIFNIRDIPE